MNLLQLFIIKFDLLYHANFYIFLRPLNDKSKNLDQKSVYFANLTAPASEKK